MWVGKFALLSTGYPEWIDNGATAVTGAAFLNGAAYDPEFDALYVTTEAVAASDESIGGFRYRADGALRVVDATAGVPAGSNTNQGLALSSDGQLCYTTTPGTTFNLNGVAVDALRRVYAAPLAFALEFADLGAGVVDTTEAITGATPTFTRATVKWTKLASGLWAQVASGSPCSLYSGFNTAVGTYLGYFSEPAATQLVTPDASIRDMTDAAWVKANMDIPTGTPGIDGTTTVSILTATAANATILQTLTAAASSRTYSCWIKRVGGVGEIDITQDGGSTWTDVTSQINRSTFTRVSLTASVLNASFGIRIVTDGNSIAVDFNQFEAGSVATSPMATAGAARNADRLSFAFAALNTQGTLFSHSLAFTTATDVIFASQDAADNSANAIFLFKDATTAHGQVASGGAVTADVTVAMTVTNEMRLAMGYVANSVQLAANGTLGTEDTSCAMPVNAQTTLIVGDSRAGTISFPFNGAIRRVAYYAARLPNATLQAMTSG